MALSPLPIGRLELERLLADPPALLNRMILSFALERPRQCRPALQRRRPVAVPPAPAGERKP